MNYKTKYIGYQAGEGAVWGIGKDSEGWFIIFFEDQLISNITEQMAEEFVKEWEEEESNIVIVQEDA